MYWGSCVSITSNELIWCEILILIRPQVVTNFYVTGDNLVRKIRKIEKWEHILETVYQSYDWMTDTFISLKFWVVMNDEIV